MDITDRGMQAKPGAVDTWLRRSLGRGCGVFEGRITPAGERRFYFRYTDPTGGRVRLLIGPYAPKPDSGGFTLAEAKAIVSEWSLLYQSGVHDLREHFERQRADKAAAEAADRERVEGERVAASRRLTVRQLFNRWCTVELAPHLNSDGKRSGRKDGGEYVRLLFEARLFPTLGDVIAADVTKSDLMTVIDKAKADGRLRTANMLLAELKQMYRFALVREIATRNPLELVTKRDAGGADVTRDRVLSFDEIKALALAVPRANLPKRSAAAVWLILATGVRISEAMGALWEHVDLKARTWYLPSTKNSRDHLIHLSDFAVAQFEALAGAKDRDSDGNVLHLPWVFPNTARTGPVDKTTFGKQLTDRQRPPERRLKNRTEATTSLALPGGRWTSHDLRRTAATTMATLGISGDVIDECLNHVIESKVRRIYIRDRRLTDQAHAFDALGARLAGLVAAPATPRRGKAARRPR